MWHRILSDPIREGVGRPFPMPEAPLSLSHLSPRRPVAGSSTPLHERRHHLGAEQLDRLLVAIACWPTAVGGKGTPMYANLGTARPIPKPSTLHPSPRRSTSAAIRARQPAPSAPDRASRWPGPGGSAQPFARTSAQAVASAARHRPVTQEVSTGARGRLPHAIVGPELRRLPSPSSAASQLRSRVRRGARCPIEWRSPPRPGPRRDRNRRWWSL